MEAGFDVVRQVLEQGRRVRASLSRVKHKVAVMSGKGGVGKSMVTANLALTLAQKGSRLGILDADIDGPSIPRMLEVQEQRMRIEAGKVAPALTMFHIKVASMAPASKMGEWEIGCFLPGHYEAGMKGRFVVRLR